MQSVSVSGLWIETLIPEALCLQALNCSIRLVLMSHKNEYWLNDRGE